MKAVALVENRVRATAIIDATEPLAFRAAGLQLAVASKTQVKVNGKRALATHTVHVTVCKFSVAALAIITVTSERIYAPLLVWHAEILEPRRRNQGVMICGIDSGIAILGDLTTTVGPLALAVAAATPAATTSATGFQARAPAGCMDSQRAMRSKAFPALLTLEAWLLGTGSRCHPGGWA